MEALQFCRHNFPSFLVEEVPPPNVDTSELACKTWYSMNAPLFSQLGVLPAIQMELASRLIDEVFKEFRKQGRKGWLQLHRVRVVRWLPPPNGFLKLNTDGALKYHNRHASVGGLVRDCLGRWVRGYVRNIGVTDDCLMTELIGVREGLYLLARMNLYNVNVVIEMDSEVAVNLLKSGAHSEHPEKDDPPALLVLKECLRIMRSMNVVECRHTLREGNRCADFLANLGQSTEEGTTMILEECPDEAYHFLWADTVGVTYLRA